MSRFQISKGRAVALFTRTYAVTLIDAFGVFGITVSEKKGNYYLLIPNTPATLIGNHLNGATIPADYFLCLPRGRDSGKHEVIILKRPRDPSGLDELQPLSGRFDHPRLRSTENIRMGSPR